VHELLTQLETDICVLSNMNMSNSRGKNYRAKYFFLVKVYLSFTLNGNMNVEKY